MPKDILEKTIKEVQEVLGDNEHISCETVRSRIKRNDINGINTYTTFSPIAKAEKYFNQTIIKMEKIKIPRSMVQFTRRISGVQEETQVR